MCGIAGVVSFAGGPIEESRLRRMAGALAHRGPDAEGVWIDAEAHAGLGFRRLAIVELSPAGHQPMRSNDGRYVLTFNGEIYNHDAIRRELGHDGFISRYSTDATDDGLSGSEGQFLACSFWLVEALALNGREAEARELFERLLALRNDLGLYAEEYDVARGRQVGNFPQAFTPLALISAARVLSGERIGTRSAPSEPLPRMPMPSRPAR